MEIPKDKIIQMIKSRRGHDEADQAQSELPEQVDPRRTRACSPSSASIPKTSSAGFAANSASKNGAGGGRSTPTTRPLRVLHPHP